MSEITHKNFFFCYSIELSKFLKRSGVSYIFKAKSIKDDSVFTLYQRTEELTHLVDRFKEESI